MLFLLPIVVATGFLINCIPISQSTRLVATLESPCATWATTYWGTQKHYALEIEDGIWREATPYEAAMPQLVPGSRGVVLEADGRLTRLSSYGEVLAQSTPKGPIYPTRAIAADSNWLVAVTNQNELLLFDRETLEQVDKMGPLPDVHLANIEGCSNILCSTVLASPPLNPVGDQTRRSIISVASGKFELVTEWISGRQVPQTSVGPDIFTLTSSPLPTSVPPDLVPPVVERRDTNGTLVEQIELPEAYGHAFNIAFVGNIAWGYTPADDTVWLFDLNLRRKLKVETSPTTWVLAANEQQIVLFDRQLDGTRRVRVYDPESETVVSSYSFPSDDEILAIRPNHFLLGSNENGATLYVVDRSSENTVKWSPFAWATWLLPIAAVVFLIWALLWLRASIRDAGAAWLDGLIISGLPFAAIFLRAHAVQPEHLTLNLCQGILLGALIGCAAWVAWGRSRLAFRLLPLFAVATFLAVALLWYLGVSRLGIEGLESTILPAAGFMLMAVLVRLIGLRCQNDCLPSAPERASIAMIDYFVLILGIAVLLAPMRYFAEEMNLVVAIGNLWLELSIASTFLTAFVWAVLSSYRWTFAVASAIAAAAAATLIYVPWYKFAFGYYPDPNDAARSIFAVLGMACVTAYAVLLPYRARGWRLRFGRRVVRETAAA